MIGLIKRIYHAVMLKNSTGVVINPATEDKQDDVVSNQTDGSQKTQIVDSGDADEEADVVAANDDSTDLEDKSALVTNSVLNGRISNTAIRPIRIDAVTQAITTINYEHHEVHAGNMYSYIEVVDLAINNVRDIQITTPNTTKWPHLVIKISCESETEWYLYENVTINTPGTAYTPINNNRNSVNNSDLSIAYIDNTSVANANADTAVAGATCIGHGITGAGKDAGDYNHGLELMLKQNENYSIRFVVNSAGFVNYDLKWYEHTNKN